MRLSIYRGALRWKWCWREVVDGCVVTHTVNVIGSREWGGWGVKLFCRIVVSGCKSTGLSFRLLLFYPRANPAQASPRPAPEERHVYSGRVPDDSLKLRTTGMARGGPHHAAPMGLKTVL